MKRSKVLIVEADEILVNSIIEYLGKEMYEFAAFGDAQAASEHLMSSVLPQIAIIAMQLPGMSGFECANELKAVADVPVIFLADSDDLEPNMEGLRKYAEDFVVKPFEMFELEARMLMVLARMPALDYAKEPVIRVDDSLTIDFAHSRMLVAGQSVGLTPTEASVLHFLLRNAPRVVETRTLLTRVWPSEEKFEDTLRVHMHRLRRKLEVDSHHPHYIRTERGIGYRFTIRPSGLVADDHD